MPQAYYFTFVVPIFVLIAGCTNSDSQLVTAADRPAKAEQKNATPEDRIRVAPVSIRRGRPQLKDQIEKEEEKDVLNQEPKPITADGTKPPLPDGEAPLPDGEPAKPDPAITATKPAIQQKVPNAPVSTAPTVAGKTNTEQPVSLPDAGGFLDQCYCD